MLRRVKTWAEMLSFTPPTIMCGISVVAVARLVLLVGACLALPACAFAQDSARIAAGEAAWDKAGCLQCHGAAGEGGTGGEFPAGPSLRAARLDRATLVETVRCGRPGSEMPAWLTGAYAEVSCYGIPKGPPPAGVERTPVLSADEIEALADYLMAKIIGK
jgi:mono/diheme cytochrome c family protein